MHKSWFVGGTGLAGFIVLVSCAMGQGNPRSRPALGKPLDGLSANELARFDTGKTTFLTDEDAAGGLGPVFTESSCVKCHNSEAPGGAGERLVTRIGRVIGGQFDPMVEFGGPLIQNRGIGKFNGVNFVGEVIPRQATIIARRRTSPLFGLGLVDAVPDDQILAIAQHQLLMNRQTAGRASISVDPITGQNRVNRFGWKAQQPTIFAFCSDAYTNEMGVTTPLLPNENCPQGKCDLLKANPAHSNPNDQDISVVEELADFVSFLAPPPRGTVGPNEQAGENIFNQIGCANCHVPRLQTGPSPVAVFDQVIFAPYSDFLLHDMGSLGDGMVQNQAGPREMRTAPLWGLRFEHSLLHDGRTTSIAAAILAHDGQGRASRNLFVHLNPQMRAKLIAFLSSL